MATPRFTKLMAVSALLLGLGVTASAQIKVGVVSLQKTLQDTAEIRQAELDLKARFGPRQEEVAAIEKDVAKLQQEYEANQGKYTESALAELGNRIQRRQVQLQRNSQALQEDVNRERQDVLGRVGQRVQDIIKKVADEKGLDLVIDSNSTLFSKPAFDISADVTAAYDRAYPVKK